MFLRPRAYATPRDALNLVPGGAINGGRMTSAGATGGMSDGTRLVIGSFAVLARDSYA